MKRTNGLVTKRGAAMRLLRGLPLNDTIDIDGDKQL